MHSDPFSFPNPFEVKPKRKRVKLTAKERIYVWEHPETYGRNCSICKKKITKLSDLELDHTKPHSKGGTKLALAHRDCNRMKGSRNLKDVQKKMGLTTTKKKKQSKTKTKPRKKKTPSPFDLTLPKTKFPLV
jgi:5-methylcytosine-specific restriction endonuclease McrA